MIKLLLLFLAFMLLGTVGFIMASFRNKVPFVPTPKRIIRMMVDMAGIQPNERICDLGSGTGRIIFTAAKKNKQNLVVGFEKSFTLRLISKFWLWVRPWLKKRVRIIEADFFNLDLFDYNVIFCFLTPEAMRSLAPKFQTLKPGSRLISYMFPLEDTQNFQEAIEHVGDKDSIYYYKKVS
ncbi:MAG: class I SAM-dependent methyltransferase [Candidatus Parcubacteria bacterium]|nr:class I SAM-dependent methyltransferase [Candidatus Parcubacteria bacterium]